MKNEHPLMLAARAKVNLCLDVVYRRADGYHELDTIFQRIALHDTVYLRPRPRGIAVACDRRELPRGPKNTVHLAAELVAREYGVDYGVEIRLAKRIPLGAGLGGGSADAAAVLRGLPHLWRLPPLPTERELALARAIGADVPFCLEGLTARAGGIGDLLTPLPPWGGLDVLLVQPPARLSTARVYGHLDLSRADHPDVEAAVAAVRAKDLAALGRSAGNVLEKPAIALVPEIGRIKADLWEAGALFVLMSGSGSTVCALSDEEGWAARTARRFVRPGWTAIVTRTVPVPEEEVCPDG